MSDLKATLLKKAFAPPSPEVIVVEPLPPEPFKKVPAFMVECRTGCSCCSGENHMRGPFKTKETAEKNIEHYKKVAPLASQFAHNGIYYFSKREAEDSSSRIMFVPVLWKMETRRLHHGLLIIPSERFK